MTDHLSSSSEIFTLQCARSVQKVTMHKITLEKSKSLREEKNVC